MSNIFDNIDNIINDLKEIYNKLFQIYQNSGKNKSDRYILSASGYLYKAYVELKRKNNKVNESLNEDLDGPEGWEYDEYQDNVELANGSYGVNSQVLQELYDEIIENYGDDYLSDYDEVDPMELEDAVSDFGSQIDGYDDSLRREYANALKEKWAEENTEDGSDLYNDDKSSRYEQDIAPYDDESNEFDDEIKECLKNAGIK